MGQSGGVFYAMLGKHVRRKKSEAESDAHLRFKEWLASFLNKGSVEVEYAKIRGVKPDLLWKQKYAIEVQHSPIFIDEVSRRNEIYYANKLIPVWIFHAEEPCYARDDDNVKRSTTFTPGHYAKKVCELLSCANSEAHEKPFRLKAVEKSLADSQLTVFYFQYDSVAPEQDGVDDAHFYVRYYHPYAEDLDEYLEFHSKLTCTYEETQLEEIEDPLTFGTFIENQLFTKEIISRFGIFKNLSYDKARVDGFMATRFIGLDIIHSGNEYLADLGRQKITIMIREWNGLFDEERIFEGEPLDPPGIYSVFLLRDLEHTRPYEILLFYERKYLLYLYLPEDASRAGSFFKYSDNGIEPIVDENDFSTLVLNSK